ncbi:MAG: response regulator transcription factor [Cellulosilyticaceae bacterium]
MHKILVIDDDVEICRLIERALTKDGYEVSVRHNVVDIDIQQLKLYQLVLLDVMMPGIDGFAFCKAFRKKVDCPILFITAKTMEKDLIEGFAVGGDDYIKKPFTLAELRARVKAHIRRDHREYHQRILYQNFCFDLSEKQLSIQEQSISLTKSEYEICEFLVRNKGQVFSIERILENVLGLDCESNSSAIREHIKNIRAKIGKYSECPIKTVWGIGYKWD